MIPFRASLNWDFDPSTSLFEIVKTAILEANLNGSHVAIVEDFKNHEDWEAVEADLIYRGYDISYPFRDGGVGAQIEIGP